MSSGRMQGSSYFSAKKPRVGNSPQFSRLDSRSGDSSRMEVEGRREEGIMDVELEEQREVVAPKDKGTGDHSEEVEREIAHRMNLWRQ